MEMHRTVPRFKKKKWKTKKSTLEIQNERLFSITEGLVSELEKPIEPFKNI